MKRRYRLRAARDFAAVRTDGKAVHSALLTLGWRLTTGPTSRFGFVAGKRVGGAVTRNLVKRRLRAIMQDHYRQVPSGYDVTLIARPPSAHCDYATLARDVRHLLQRAHLWQVTHTVTGVMTTMEETHPESSAARPEE